MPNTDCLNLYGDTLVPAGFHGADIASQRADDLDQFCLADIGERVPFCLDLGCGQGGQSLRMAEMGAKVLAVDSAMSFTCVHPNIEFECADALDFVQRSYLSFDVVSCQRMIHYLPASGARSLVEGLFNRLKSRGSLYLSASGIKSELSDGYFHRNLDWEARFCMLSSEMAVNHNIMAPVCLYSESDMQNLLAEAGFTEISVFSSAFGNIKAKARKP